MVYRYVYYEDPEGPKEAECPRCGKLFALVTGGFVPYGNDEEILFCSSCSQLPLNEDTIRKLKELEYQGKLKTMPNVSSESDGDEEDSES